MALEVLNILGICSTNLLLKMFISCFVYRTPDLNYSFKKNEGWAYNYFAHGSALSEVEIDCLTGDHQVNLASVTHQLYEGRSEGKELFGIVE